MDSLINEKKRLENHIALRKTEVKHLENVVNEIQQKIYNLCEHVFVNEVESGIYPETYYVCKARQQIFNLNIESIDCCLKIAFIYAKYNKTRQ